VLAAAGYNFRRLLAWLAMLWRVLITAVLAQAETRTIAQPVSRPIYVQTSERFLHGRLDFRPRRARHDAGGFGADRAFSIV
jgi:hypothetical protein